MLDRDGVWAALPEYVERKALSGAFDNRAAWLSELDGMAGQYCVDRGVAIVCLEGLITKSGSWFGSSANETRQALQIADRDPEVATIVLKIDSPGGQLPGIDELAETYAGLSKPTVTYYEDLGASAAFWVGAQGGKSYANRQALLGGVGVYRVVIDSSAAAEQQGLKVLVVKSGERKGDAVPGTPVTDEALAEVQRSVDRAHDRFVRAVASGRKLSLAKTRELADGRVHGADEAKQLGLIDDVKPFEAVVDSLARKTKPKSKNQSPGARAMSEQTDVIDPPTPAAAAAPRAATFQELKAELIGADASFLVAQLEASSTLDQARKAWMGELNARNQASAKAADDARKAAEAAAKKPGVDPLPGGSATAAEGASGDAISAFDALVDAELKAMGGRAAERSTSLSVATPRGRAVIAAAQKNPEAHRAYLLAYNAEHRKRYGSRSAVPLNPAAHIGAE